MKIDGFEQKDSQGFENSYNSYELYPFFIFTIYQNYTLALIRQSQQRPFHPYGPSSSLGQGLAATLKCDKESSAFKVQYAVKKSDVTRHDHVSVVMDAGSRIVNFTVNFIRDGTVFA